MSTPSLDAKGNHSELEKRDLIGYAPCMFGKSLCARVIKNIAIHLTGGKKHTYRWAMNKDLKDQSYFYGSQWWCISGEAVNWMMLYLSAHLEYERHYKRSICPDESFFQTLFMRSPYKDKRMESLCYVDWSEGNSSPKTLTDEDYDKLIASNALLARKFEFDQDSQLLYRLIEHNRR